MSRAQPSEPAAGLGAARSRTARLRAWAARLRARRTARAARAAAVQRLFAGLTLQARAFFFYRALGVPDTPEGRFEMVGLHAALVLLRLRREGEAGRALGQALFDLMVAEVDQGLRELGVGDLKVGRQVKRLAGQFYARLQALDQALAAGDRERLEAMLRGNVWQGGKAPGAAQVGALAGYLVRCARRLDEQRGETLLAGEAAFAALDDGPPDRPADRQAH